MEYEGGNGPTSSRFFLKLPIVDEIGLHLRNGLTGRQETAWGNHMGRLRRGRLLVSEIGPRGSTNRGKGERNGRTRGKGRGLRAVKTTINRIYIVGLLAVGVRA